MALQITFNTDGLTLDEATALARLLDTVAPGTLAAAVSRQTSVETQAVTVAVEPDETGDEDDAPTDPAVVFGNGPLPFGATSAPAPEPVAGPAVAGVEVDVTGLPWDARFHAGTKRQNADGKWTAKKGVHEETVRVVTDQLRANMAAPAAVPPPPPPPAPAAPIVPPPPLATPAAAVNPSMTGPQMFAALMAKVTAAQTAGKLATEQLNAIVAGVGLSATSALMMRPDLIPTVEAQVDALVAAAG